MLTTKGPCPLGYVRVCNSHQSSLASTAICPAGHEEVIDDQVVTLSPACAVQYSTVYSIVQYGVQYGVQYCTVNSTVEMINPACTV